ncbi:MAG TPA: hypothetical protein PKO27_15555 [Deltaproteobacteria bacterium]|nr:hypothetical protein [Deltaproteobacteria bacterium]
MNNIDDFVKGFVSSWNGFLDDLMQVTTLKLATKRPRSAYEENLVPILEKIVTDLKEDHITLYATVRTELAENMASKDALTYLQHEFSFFHELVTQLNETAEPDNEDVDNAIEAGETIKGSFEQLIEKLPERWKKILKVVNEILSLLKIAI